AVNVMQAPYFDADHYRSDSNQHWRSGCPHEDLAAGRFEWLQLLSHPEIWVYPGRTMRETMLSMLDAERDRDLERLADDRIELELGRHLCDAFYVVPPGADPSFAVALTEICKNEQVDAVLPQSSFELHALAENRGSFGETTVLVAGLEAVRRSNDKAETYALLDEIGVRGPAWRRTRSAAEVEAAARELGYPGREVAF